MSAYIDLLIQNGITQRLSVTHDEDGGCNIATIYEHFMPEERDAIIQSADSWGGTVIEEDGKLIVNGGFKDFPPSD